MFDTPWIAMWSTAGLVWAACKWAGWRHYPGPWSAAYWFTWPGLDPRPFHQRRAAAPLDWRPGAAKFGLGVAGFAVARLGWPSLWAIWLAMVSSLLVAHFGTIHLVCVWLRRRGVAVEPLMAAPLQSTSLAEFWGRRWNTAFRDFSYRLVFLPVARRWGARAGSLAVFLFSGAVHDLVISLPAGGAYGLPTAYFLLQALGVYLEKRWHVSGRLWTVAWLSPMPWLLFPPVFVERVMRPFYERILGL